MKRVDVTHVAPLAFGAAGVWGGGERYPLALAEAMSERVPTRLVTFGPKARRWRQGELEICELPARMYRFDHPVNPLSERLALYLPLTRRIHVHVYQSVLTNVLLIAGRALGRPVFVTDHGGGAPNYNERFGLERLITSFLPVSSFSAGFYPELAPKTTGPLLGGADPKRFHPGEGPRPRQVVYVGRLLPHKGVDVLIRAVEPSMPLHLYGRSYDETYLHHLHGLAEGKDVVFHHSATDAEIAAAYRTARVSVLPSLYKAYDGSDHPFTELLGLSVIEALASGTPVVASRVGGVPEVVTDGENGHLIEPGNVAELRDRIGRLLDDPDHWSQMAANALESFRAQLTWSRVAERALNAYESAR
jgi:glycosyltransferase involved in cell wall biosynthesis